MSSAYTLSDVRTRAYDFVARLLRDGPIRDVLAGLRREAVSIEDFNVLRFFYDLDSRFFAVSDDDREEAYDAYCAWNWNLDLGFYGNWSAMESLVREMERLDCDPALVPDRRQLYQRARMKLLRLLPAMQPHFDFVERVGGPAAGSGKIEMLCSQLVGCIDKC